MSVIPTAEDKRAGCTAQRCGSIAATQRFRSLCKDLVMSITGCDGMRLAGRSILQPQFKCVAVVEHWRRTARLVLRDRRDSICHLALMYKSLVPTSHKEGWCARPEPQSNWGPSLCNSEEKPLSQLHSSCVELFDVLNHTKHEFLPGIAIPHISKMGPRPVAPCAFAPCTSLLK